MLEVIKFVEKWVYICVEEGEVLFWKRRKVEIRLIFFFKVDW